MSGPAGPSRADGLAHPVPLAAIALLVLNDHALKAAWPGWVTGKLSDVAGLVFFPLMLQAFVELADRREPFRPSDRVLVGCAALTALVFALCKTWIPAAETYRVGLGWLQWPFRLVLSAVSGEGWVDPARVRLARDPTDLLALPGVLLAVRVGRARCRSPREKLPGR